ncbi:hypothetical protein DM01DRAFT_1350096 [Hesseltinella vesiculosa]|uniref:S15/NS1 RNA-binding domain-containing protein n=1 Tax=Hesseltinella vesiculosa TaxID=101127 RepID=A0A1X2G2T0_9FUNG|nr:hypothetical protein DM01DRAFT_1350096 [Hesseltinella vesiculosa]
MVVRGFHGSASALAKKHPKQVKKENLARRASRLAEYESSKPSPIVSRHTSFFDTLQTPASAYNSGQHLYQHFLNENDQRILFEQTPRDTVEKNHLAAVGGVDDALKHEQEKIETLQKIISLQNGNAKAVQLWNIQKAVDWFKQSDGDTGSPEVQAAILTVRIHNLHSHLQQHSKDKHNQRQLRTMVHKRAKMLRYLKTKDLSRYNTCLDQLGLEARAVEGEITL